MLMKSFVRKIPGIRKLLLWQQWRKFSGSSSYWEQRYGKGGNSGSGSYGPLAEFKASVLNRFVQERGVASVIEFGCGDGNQLSLAKYPQYIGLDVSRTAIQLCKSRFASDITKSFFLYDPDCFVDNAHVFRCETALSLDVLFHLVDDEVFERYLAHLFASAERHAIIYSSNADMAAVAPQEKHRCFTDFVMENFPEWRFVEKIANSYPLSKYAAPLGSLADFYLYERVTSD